jgi:two-component system, NtrC family, sensor kinase
MPSEQGYVLIVDDNEANRDVLARRLDREGHTVAVAENGHQALEMMRAQEFDLVLLDIIMPGMDGYQVLEYLKADAALRHIPVIVISAVDALDSAVRCIELGAEDYLSKPFNQVLLKARIDASLEKKRLRAQEQAYLKLRFESEKAAAEEALYESEERYRTLVDRAPIGVITCDRGGNITNVNPALLEIADFSDKRRFRQINLLTRPSLVKAGIAATFHRCMEEEITVTADYHYRSDRGKTSVLHLRLTPLHDENGTINGALGTVEDVTEQRQLQEQLVQSAKLASIGELAAGVAHEINNPINGIINYAQLLLNKAEPSSRQAHFLEGILREGDRVANIVRDLLIFARVDTEGTSPAHVSDILSATLTLNSQQVKKDGIVLEIEEQSDLPQVRCRSQRIQQVFLNLISNARDALNARYPGPDPNKRLTVRIEQIEKEGQSYVRTTFHDLGVGIPAQNLSRVFAPFFTTKKPGEGTGLGLSVSYGIIQDHHGDIQVESVEGEYTIFRVDLPV